MSYDNVYFSTAAVGKTGKQKPLNIAGLVDH